MASVLSFVQAMPFTEDVLVMSTFIIGFMIWDRLKTKDAQSGKRNLKSFVTKTAVTNVRDIRQTEAMPSVSVAESPQKLMVTATPGDNDWIAIPEHHDAAIMENKMIKLLENKSFRHALNLFRFVRRTVGIQEYSEELFLPFIQSAIRVGKMDVVEYMLKSMTEIPNLSAPSYHFWRTILKYLVSRKEYGACLSAHDIFGAKIPLDNIIFRCLITAELEMGVPEHARRVLKRLVLNDRGRGVHQEAHWLFNAQLLFCVNDYRLDRAVQLFRHAQALEKIDGAEKIVNSTSHSTLIRGFVRNNSTLESVQSLNDMLGCGFEPEDDICRMVIDCCIKHGKMDAARNIEERLESASIAKSKLYGSASCSGRQRSHSPK